MEIRKKEKVSITEAWKNEEKDFTPWLIKNLDELSKTMRQNITVTDAQREVRSGRYELDILGKIGNENVIIENMYGKTNHDHLGKCITYAAIHKAKYLIWIAETFQPEELTSVDWLNENFSVESGINFFAVEISVWKSVDEKGNSGVFWAVNESEEYSVPYLTAPEIQVLDDDIYGKEDTSNYNHMNGALYDMVAPSELHANPTGEWNKYLIEINYNDNIGKVKLNDKDAIEFPLSGNEWNNLIKNSKFKDWGGFAKTKSGPIAFQDHGTKVYYRNIKIKEL